MRSSALAPTAVKAGGLLYVPKGLVLVQRFGSGRDGLVIPKGSPKPEDAHLGITAQREVLEETGHLSYAAIFLGMFSRGSIDVESPEAHKTINVFLMAGDGTTDPSVVPDQSILFVDPREAAYGNIMRYEEEARFIAMHLGTLLRVHSW